MPYLNDNKIYMSADTGGRTSNTKAAPTNLTKRNNVQTPMRYRNTTPTTTTTKKTTTAAPAAEPVQEEYYGGDYYEGGGGGGFDVAAFLAELMAQKRAAAEEAYQRNMERIKANYESAAANLKSNYETTSNQLNASRDKSMGEINTDAEKSLREAYINNMLSRKNLNQRLSALGYNGGATETTMAQLDNQYGNSRTSINDTLNSNIANLNQTFGDNLASALQSYNSALSDLDIQKLNYEMAAENARTEAEAMDISGIGSLLAMNDNYLSALSGAVSNLGNYSYDRSSPTNQYVGANVTQAQSAANDANFAKYLAQAQLSASNGASSNTIKNELFNAVRNGQIGIDTLYAILQKLGS